MTTETGMQRAKRMVLDLLLAVTLPLWMPLFFVAAFWYVVARSFMRWWYNDGDWDFDQ